MLMMDKDRFMELAKEYSLVPVAKRIPADTQTPVSTYLKTAKGCWSFLLESVEGGTNWGRYSIVGFDPLMVYECTGEEALLKHKNGGEERGEPLALLRSVIRANEMPRIEGLPRFSGGLVGYFGYGSARLFEELPPRGDDPVGLPDIRLFAPGKLLAFDNVSKTLDIIVLARPESDPALSYELALKEIDGVLSNLKANLSEEEAFPPPSGAVTLSPVIARERFESMVETAREAIHAGEAIQIVLSQIFEGEGEIDPFTVYRALRILNPSPYLFHLAMGEEVLVGASPEVMVRVEEDKAMVRPIAGTRHRGKNTVEDLALEQELLADEKERAEHVMLVDLGRNDLGRIANPGEVTLEESFVVERYSHVMHLVSTVSAKVGGERDALDVLAATFPAGTVSGAPKVRAMEIIAELEERERGFYAGAVGYLGFDGNLDTCITIRTILFSKGKVYLQAGAGIVADSSPAFEYEETLHKSDALRRALEMAAEGLSS
ncbi:MAG: anthranilate synthase component I [Deltaproteobacteria bacterium]|nr:MAG: anthranilate synthase component I [Deltaproteobacteria bacterium]